jgi:DNA-binding CsgD family transcriptional regulator
MSRPRIAALRALPEQRRSWLCTRLERGDGRITAAKARRQSEIVRRHVFGAESQGALCGEFAISVQQFYVDRREGIRRALALAETGHAEIEPDEIAPVENEPVENEPVENEPVNAAVSQCLTVRGGESTLIAHATALHEAGVSLRAAGVLDELPAGRTPSQSLEALALALEVDRDIGRDRVALELGRWRTLRDTADGAERRIAEAGLAWIESNAAENRGDRLQFRAAFISAVAALRRCVRDDAGHAIALVRFLVAAVPSLIDFGESVLASEALAEAAAIIGGRDDAPVALRAMLHANRAFALSTDPGTLGRASAEGEKALAIARSNALPRTTWVCLYLRVFENIWRGDPGAALDDASELYTSVEASDSRPWRRIARSRLSNALSALGRPDDAARVIEPLREAADPLFGLQSCALAFRRGRYVESLAAAGQMVRTFAAATPALRANALLYSAASAHRLRDLERAAVEISDAVALFESSPAPNLFIAHRAYALGHAITGRTRYRDAARDLQNAFDAAHDPGARPCQGSTLTRRQQEIARLAAAGATNRAIATKLGISSRTVGNHLAATFAALEIRARWQLEEALRKASATDCAS